MKKISLFQLLILFMLMFTSAASAQQDHIITLTGKTVSGHVKRVHDDEIVYRKLFHKYTIPTKKVLYIVYEDGKKKEINPITDAKHYKSYGPQKSDPNSSFHPAYIERIGNKYRIDTTQLVSLKQLNKLVSQSPNPMVKMQLKTAKLMHTFQTVSKITSYPSSMGGAFASYKTFTVLFDQMKAGPVPFKTYFNAGISFLGTI
ncbi:MAG TPA: hypothetical protein VI112_14120, partial [Bacteroidia bacterium]